MGDAMAQCRYGVSEKLPKTFNNMLDHTWENCSTTGKVLQQVLLFQERGSNGR